MKILIEPSKIDWWFWTITLALIVAALLGWSPGHYAVMVISGVQVVFFWIETKSVFAFETQVRIVYFLLTLLGLIRIIQFPFYVLLLLGTLMVVFFGRCSIALVLIKCRGTNNRSSTYKTAYGNRAIVLPAEPTPRTILVLQRGHP